jgi:LCP family protein required for cell wall assembly
MDGLRQLGKDLSRSSSSGSKRRGSEAPEAASARQVRRGMHSRAGLGVRRRWPRRALIAANIVTVLALIGAGSAYAYVQWRLGQIKHIHIIGLHATGHSAQSHSSGASTPPFTMLVIGSDTRAIANGNLYGGTTDVQGQRSDSIILVRVNPKTRALALMSIPRDTLVAVPGYGTTRINVAFNAGTPSLLVKVLDQDFGIQVNHVAEFNFDTFQAVASAVGGVEQYFPSPAKDIYSGLNIPVAGCYNLTGGAALAFVRSREYQYEINGQWNYQLYPESDLARIQRQQAFVKSLVRKAKKVAPTDVFKLNNIIGGITKNLTLDSTFSNSLILSLAQDFRSANLTTIPSYTYPTVNSSAVPGALDPQTAQGQAVVQQWLNVGQPPAAPSSPTPPKSPPTTTLQPASIKIEVQNGSGVAGQAGQAGQELASLGYHTTVTGDAPNFGLATTVIQYAPDSLAAAKQVQSQLASASTLVEDSALTPTAFNIELVTGQNFSGVLGAASAASPATTAPPATTTTLGSPAYSGTATVNPASSSIYQGVYIPPGLQPGQTPQTCGE